MICEKKLQVWPVATYINFIASKSTFVTFLQISCTMLLKRYVMWLVLTLIYTVDLFWNSAIYEPHIGSVFLNNCINLKAKNVEQKTF